MAAHYKKARALAMGDFIPVSSDDSSGQSPLSVAEPPSLAVACPLEPTAEMVEAGVSVLWQSGVVEGQLDSDELLVADIYRAMLRLA